MQLHDYAMPDDLQRDSIDALHAFHDALLPGTIHNALQTSFFRQHWASCAPAGNGPDARFTRAQLAQLPLIDKEDIRAAGTAAQNRAGVVCNDVLTSGTTGNPLVTVRSDREQNFIAGFLARQWRHAPGAPILRGLQFTNPYHGHLIRVPAPIHYHRISVYDAGSFDYARATLLRTHADAHVADRCSVLSGLERCLRAFTLDTIDRYPEGFPPTALRLVVTHSQYLTPAWRQRLEHTWDAPVADAFSVSEIYGSASQCLQCGWYHFEPCVIAEVVGAASGTLLGEGAGLLALTALYPFQQAQPLVRYLTGDLVAVTHTASCRPGTTAIKPLGRARYGVPLPATDDWLLTPAAILEAVDELPDIARIPRFADVDQVTDPYAIGHPKYRTTWTSSATGLAVAIALALVPGVPEPRRAHIRAGLIAALTAASEPLQRALQAGTASLGIDFIAALQPDLIAQAHSGGVWSQA